MCGEVMKSGIENCTLTYMGQEYHADALVYRCRCGYAKLGTCDVHILLNDEPDEDEHIQVPDGVSPRSSKRDTASGKLQNVQVKTEPGRETSKQANSSNHTVQNSHQKEDEASEPAPAKDGLFHPKGGEKELLPKPAPGMPFPFGNGRHIISDAWLDWMLEHHAWFKKPYERLFSFSRRQERYFSSHKPDYRAIRNNILYDTGKATLFYEEAARDGKAIIKRYYYDAGNGRYFCIRSKYGENDDFDVKIAGDIKRLLMKHPDIYVKVIHEKVENMEAEQTENMSKESQDAANKPSDDPVQDVPPKRPDPTNGRKPLV